MAWELEERQKDFDKKRHIVYTFFSTEEQNYKNITTLLQETNLRIDKLIEEKNYKSSTKRKALKEILSWIDENDVLIVTELTQLAHSVKELLDIIECLQEKKVQLVSLKEQFDINNDTRKLFIRAIKLALDFQKNIFREKVAIGIQKAKERGIYQGRKKKTIPENFPFLYENYKKHTMTATSICKQIKISRPVFYRMVKEYEQDHKIDKKNTDSTEDQ